MRIMLIHPNMWASIHSRGLDRFMTPVLTPLGIGSIAAYMKRLNYDVAVVDAHAEKLYQREVVELIKQFSPDVVGFSLPIEVTYSACIAKAVKQIYPDTIIIAGGVIPSATPELLLTQYPVFDYAVIGEGEEVFRCLVETLEQRGNPETVPGIAYKSKGQIWKNPRNGYIEDLNALPYPAFNLLPTNRYGLFGKGPLALLEASRGCIGNCWFCTISDMFGHTLRQKNPLRVMDEMEACYYNYRISYFGFADSTFTADKHYTHALLDEIIKRNMHKKIKWRCVTRVDCVDAVLLNKMKRAGCVEIGFGVESIRQDQLNLYKKGISMQNIKYAFAQTIQARISPFALMVINQYDESVHKIWFQTIKFLVGIGAEHIILRPLVIYPGTSLHKKLLEKKHIKNSSIHYFFHGKSLESPHISFGELVSLMNKMYVFFYIRIGFIGVLFKNIPRLKIFYKLKSLFGVNVKK